MHCWCKLVLVSATDSLAWHYNPDVLCNVAMQDCCFVSWMRYCMPEVCLDYHDLGPCQLDFVCEVQSC